MTAIRDYILGIDEYMKPFLGYFHRSERLRFQGHDVGRYRARSLMKKAGVSVKHRKKFKITTDSKHNLPVVPNLLNQIFQVVRPYAVWGSDISYLWTKERWLRVKANG